MIKLAYLVSHPIQYQAPLLRLISEHPEIDLTVFFCSNISMGRFVDPEFKQAISWDIPLVEGYKHQFLPTIGRPDVLGFVMPVVYGLRNRLLTGKYDALWVHGWGHWSHIYAIEAAHRMGIKVLLRGEANLHLESASKIKKLVKAIFMRWLMSRTDQFLTIGSWNKEFYLHYGAAMTRLHHVPYAVDNVFFQAMARDASRPREQFRASLGLEAGKPIILYASKLTLRKRVIDLLEAYIKLSPDGRSEPNVYLLIVGGGELQTELLLRIKKLGWNSIKILGFKNQSELPAYYDPWGLVINEVMNAAKPVIVSDQVGCAPDLVRHKENGYIFRAGDIDDLCKGLRFVLSDSERCRAMGQKSLEIINRWGFEEDVIGLRKALNLVLGN
jgi:glycosyltransferase involved in cell wall biosynthesis